MAKAIRKSTKERKMPYSLQLINIKNYLARRGYPTNEIDDIVDPTLHYDENIEEVKMYYGISDVRQMTPKEAIVEQANRRMAARTQTAQVRDYRIRARKTYTPRQIINNPRLFNKWLNSPNKYDIKGIDVSEKAKVQKRKKSTKRKVKKK